MEICTSIILLLSIKCINGKWIPELKFQPNFDQFNIYKSNLFDNVVYSEVKEQIPEDFQWQSIASFSLPFRKVSYVIYGGNQNNIKNSKSAFTKQSSLIIICELIYLEDLSNLSNVQCKRVNTGESNWYLGVAIETLSLSDREAVIVYCDPHWHAENISDTVPSGKCYLDYINDRKVERRTNIEFCRLSSTSFTSCLGGFSVDLITTNKLISGIQMVVGMPFLTPYGHVKLVSNPFQSKSINSPRNGVGKYFNFGYAVSMFTEADIYASSPLSDHYGPNVTDISNDIVLTSPDNHPFSSFGLSLKTLSISLGRSHAVVIGAPFHSYKTIQNVGKAYVFCISSDKKRSKLAEQLHGESKDEFYGYSLANIGDINGDGNADLAIGSPFLNDDDGRGFVSIYTVHKDCTVTLLQTLRSTASTKSGIFGLSITGGSDLDFNSWLDIAVLSSRSNSIEVFSSRVRLKARCTFTIPNQYESELLRRGDEIAIRVFIYLADIRNQARVNLEFLKPFELLTQVNPTLNTTEKRFDLKSRKPRIVLLEASISVSFTIISLMDVKEMKLSQPALIALRLLEDCSGKPCDNLKFPLIDWDTCYGKVPIKKYICSTKPTCEADLSVKLSDMQGSEVTFGHDVAFSRSLELRIHNAGPTEAKDINFRVFVNQNLRIHQIKVMPGVTLRDTISSNQTEATCVLDQYEIDINMTVTISIDLYFVDYKDSKKMKYVDNFINVELFSDVLDPSTKNNHAQINYTFVYRPQVTYSGSPTKDTIIDSRNRSQLIQRGQRLPIDTVGPMVTHDYVVENSGNASITNMVVKITLPIEITNEYKIMYLFDRIRGINKSEAVWMDITPQVFVGNQRYPCQLPYKYVNPLNLIGFETHVLHLSNMDIRRIDERAHIIKRRSISESQTTSSTTAIANDKLLQAKMYRIPVELVQCGRVGGVLSTPVCEDIVCRVPVLPPNKQAKIQINAWLWAYTFFKKQISDIRIYSSMKAEFENFPEGVRLQWDQKTAYSQSQQFIFQNVKPKITHFKPWWPIIVGIVIGILILAILIVAMYKCGFFQRHKMKRRFKSSRNKKSAHQPVILHPGELQTASSVTSEARYESHSALIK